MAVLDSTGLTIRRYPEILETIKEALRVKLFNGLDLGEDTYLGQISSIIAREFAQLEEILQVIEDSKDRDKAEGTALDNLLYTIGVTRQGASSSSGEVYATCEEGTIIPAYTILKSESGDTFRIETAARALPESCRSVMCDIEDTSGDFVIHINDTIFTYTRLGGDDIEDIIDGLVNLINAGSSPQYSASREVIDEETQRLYVQSDEKRDIRITLGSNLKINTVTVAMQAELTETGAINVPPYTVTDSNVKVSGVKSFFNPEEFGIGRDRETDEEFRLRASKELSIAGSATYAALFAAVSNLSGVSNVVIIENDTSNVDMFGNPPHSFEVIVDTPNTQQQDILVARTILNEKPVGIQSVGNVDVVVLDNNNQSRTIKFSRPVQKYIAIKVEYTVFDEEPLTTNLSEVIIDSIMEYGKTLTTGVDVIPSRFLPSIYKNTTGIGEITVTAQILPTINATPNNMAWSDSRLTISPKETPSFVRSNVIVELAS